MENILLPAVLFAAYSLLCTFVFLLGLQKAAERTGWPDNRRRSFLVKAIAGIALWIGLITVLSLSGFFNDFSRLPPRPLFLLLVAMAAIIIVAFSRPVQQILNVTPPHWLVYLQSFRIGVEILLWLSFTKNLIPVQMSWEGYNYDVLSGLLALPAGYLMARYPSKARTVGIAYNTIGILLLLNILVIAVLSMPTPFRYFTNEPANTIVGRFPFIFLPAVLVVLAIALHVFSLRQLLTRHVPVGNHLGKVVSSE
jgi:hypothetical protein